jgi:hypothetical protein
MPEYSFRIREWPKPPDHVFGLATPSHMLHKLSWEIRRFKDRLKTAPEDLWGTTELCYMAFNAAVTAFHCGDWAWRALGVEARLKVARKYRFDLIGKERDDLGNFLKAMRRRRAIDICRSIANGSKHMGASGKPESPFSVSTVWEFRAEPDVGQTVSYLAVQDGDTLLRVEDVFDDAFLFWESLYRDLGFIEDRFIEAD